jgi:L-asparagine transporter-like permease
VGLLRRRSSRRSRVLVVVVAAVAVVVAVAPWNQTRVGVEVWFPMFWRIYSPSFGRINNLVVWQEKAKKYPQGVSGAEGKKKTQME